MIRACSVPAFSKLVPAAGLVLLLPLLSALAQDAAETPPTFKAAELLPEASLKGPNYEILPEVRNDGFLNRFSVVVDGQTHAVAGNAVMRERLRELAVLEKMEEIRRSESFQTSLKNAATGPFKTVKGLVTEPVDTVGGIASGVGTFFTGIGHSLFGSPSEQEEGVLKTAVGFAEAKRRLAFQFGIDPYTTFPPVEARLDEIAWASTAGGLTVSVGFAAIPGAAGGVVSGTKTASGMKQLIRDNTPAELKKINAEKLRVMQVNERVAELFLEHPRYSPSMKTVLVEALAQVGAHDRQVFVERAILVQDETMGRFMVRWAEMFAAYHVQVEPVERVVKVGRAPFAQRADGVLVGLLPTDYLAWTADIAGRHATNMKSIRNVSGVTGGELWFTGSISPTARQRLEAENWVVREKVETELGLE